MPGGAKLIVLKLGDEQLDGRDIHLPAHLVDPGVRLGGMHPVKDGKSHFPGNLIPKVAHGKERFQNVADDCVRPVFL